MLDEAAKEALDAAIKKQDLKEAKELISKISTSSFALWEHGFNILTYTLQTRQLCMATMLINRGCKLKLSPHEPSALHIAVLNGNLKIIKLILKKTENGVQICSLFDETTEGLNAFHIFAHREPVDKECRKIFEYLLRKSKINLRSSISFLAPIHCAAKCGNAEMVELLLSKDLKQINSVSGLLNYTPLHIAVENNHIQVINVLLKKCANVKLKTRKNESALCLAVKFDFKPIIHLLLKYYPENPILGSYSFQNEQMLMYCSVQSKDKALVNFFLKEKVHPDEFSKETGKTPLHLAIENGLLDIVKLFLKHKANIFAVKVTPRPEIPEDDIPVGFSVLHFAVRYNQSEIFKCLVEFGAPLNIKDSNGQNSLHIAAQQGDFYPFSVIRSEEYKISAFFSQDSNGQTPLHIAVSNDYVDLVRQILQIGIPVDSKTSKGFTSIYLASKRGNREMIKLLLEFNADVNVSGPGLETALFVAALKGDPEIVEILSQVSNRGEVWLDGYVALYIAAFNGHEDTIKILLQEGADPNAKFENFLSPLHAAAQKGHESIVNLLLEAGADVNVEEKDDYISTPLLTALFHEHENIALIILDHEANVNVKLRPTVVQEDEIKSMLICGYGSSSEFNNKIKVGYTPLHFALKSGKKSIVEKLVENGADVNSEDGLKASPLFAAFELKHYEIVYCLLESGARVDIDILFTAISRNDFFMMKHLLKFIDSLKDHGSFENKDGFTLLHQAIKSGDEDIVDALLRKDFPVNIVTEKDYPLHYAIDMKNKEVIEALILHGADLNSVCDKKLSPMLHALMRNDLNIVKMLMREGVSLERTPRGKSLLHFAFDNMLRKETCEFLVECGENVNERNEINLSLIERIMYSQVCDVSRPEDRNNQNSGEAQIVKKVSLESRHSSLKELNDNDELTDKFTNISLILKGFYDQNSFLSLFLKFGFDVNIILDTSGKTLLHYACLSMTSDELDNILLYNPDLNVLDSEGNTAFSYAVSSHLSAWDYFQEELCSEEHREEQELTLHPDLNMIDFDNMSHYDGKSSQPRLNNILKNRDEFKHIARSMTQAVAKLEAAGKEIHKINLDLLKSETVHLYHSLCVSELKNIKRTFLSRTVTLFDVLMGNELQLVSYFENEGVHRAFKKINLRRLYPLFAPDLRVQVEIALERIRLTRIAKTSFIHVVKFNVPDIIVEHIFILLNLNDLKNLCRIFTPFRFISR